MAVRRLQQFFDSHPDVEFVRLVLADHSAVLRVAVLPRDAALEAAEQGFINATISAFVCMFTTFEGFYQDGMKRGIDKLIPDWDSLKVCTFYPAHAMVMCAIQEPPIEGADAGEKNEGADARGAASDEVNGETSTASEPNDGFDLCPRTVLAKQVKRAKAMNQELLVGIELEFLLYKPGADFTRPKPNSNFTSTALYSHEFTAILDEIVLALAKADIKILKYHPEAGIDGLFEIVLPPYRPIQAADAMIYCRETIKTIAKKNGYEATLCPSPFEKSSGLGAHTSISISDTSNGKADHFLAGILENFLAINAFAMPSAQSGQRIAGSMFLKPVRWGRDNKACSVRERKTGLWEFRSPDATMNPYLAIAAFIAAGLAGIEGKKEIKVKPQLSVNFVLGDEEREELGITEDLPESYGPLLAALKKSTVLKSALGDRLVKFYAGVKEKDMEDARSMTVREISERLRVVF